jgi:hypothetical protein
MAKALGETDLFSLRARGKFGEPNGFGLAWFGWTKFGTDQPLAGYYQKHWNRFGFCNAKLRHYWPKKHTSGPGFDWNNVFKDGMAAWMALTPEERGVYNKAKYKSAQTGCNAFMKNYLKAHRSGR